MTAMRNFHPKGYANPRNVGEGAERTAPVEPALNDGEIDEVLDRVGGDPLLASAAVALEEESADPRADLIEALVEFVETVEEDAAEVEAVPVPEVVLVENVEDIVEVPVGLAPAPPATEPGAPVAEFTQSVQTFTGPPAADVAPSATTTEGENA